MSDQKTLAALILFASMASCCLATSLPIGGSVIPGTGVELGSLLATRTQQFTEPTFVGTLTASVYRENNGTLTFTDQFSNTKPNDDILVRLTDSAFGHFTTDVSYDLVTAGQISPTKATRSVDGNQVMFYFPDAAGVHSGQTSALLLIRTNARAYVTGNTSIRDSYTATVDTFAPSVPEPTSLSPLWCACGMLARRRH